MNRLLAIRAMARGVLLESVRRKDLWVIAILGFLITIASTSLSFFGFEGLQSFAKDLGASVLSGLSAIIAVVTTARVLPEEIRQRTLYPLIARPVTRWDVLLGKFVGCLVVTWFGFFLLCLTVALGLALMHVPFEFVMFQYVFVKMMGLAVLCAVTMMMSVYLTPQATVTLSLILSFGSSVIIRGLTMSYSFSTPTAQFIARIVNWSLPQYGLFDLGGRVTYSGWGPVHMDVVGLLIAYACIYAVSMLVLGWIKFNRQAV